MFSASFPIHSLSAFINITLFFKCYNLAVVLGTYIYCSAVSSLICIISRHFFSWELTELNNCYCFANKALCVVLYHRLVRSLHVDKGRISTPHRYHSHRLILSRLSLFTFLNYTKLSGRDGLRLRCCNLAKSGHADQGYNTCNIFRVFSIVFHLRTAGCKLLDKPVT